MSGFHSGVRLILKGMFKLVQVHADCIMTSLANSGDSLVLNIFHKFRKALPTMPLYLCSNV